MRELVDTAYYYDLIVEKLKRINTKAKEIQITVNPKIVNDVIGYKKENIEKIRENYNLEVVVKQNEKLKVKKMDVQITKTYKEFADDNEIYTKRK